MKIIINSNENKTVKEYLRKMGISSNLIKRLKRLSNGITVNSVQQNVNYVLEFGDVLEIELRDFPEDENEYLEPCEMSLDIIYEDENLTVVNKASGMPTHQSLNHHGNTLANGLAYRHKHKSYVFRAVNRLDKDTSGVVLTANNMFYASLLSRKIKNNEINKEYIAIVNGRLESSGIIDAPIDRMGESIIKRVVRDDGDSAITEYKSLAATDEISVILVRPKTGRTHQIRVHLSHIGHPIVGDALYFKESEHIERQALHCMRMSIEGMDSYFAPLPADMLSLIRRYFKDESFLPKN